jgi:hypothetical protein
MGCRFCALKKKEIAIATARGWGVTEYLQLDWMNDGTDGWMEKASRPQHLLLYVIREGLLPRVSPNLRVSASRALVAFVF